MSRYRLLSWIGVLALALGSLALGTRSESSAPSAVTRADRIAAELRCPVCQGLSVLDSDSPTARSIRQDLARRVGDGQSDAEIRQAYVDRYGEWILLRPRGRGVGALVWVLPLASTLGGLGGLTFALWRWRRRLTARATRDDHAIVERALVTSSAMRHDGDR